MIGNHREYRDCSQPVDVGAIFVTWISDGGVRGVRLSAKCHAAVFTTVVQTSNIGKSLTAQIYAINYHAIGREADVVHQNSQSEDIWYRPATLSDHADYEVIRHHKAKYHQEEVGWEPIQHAIIGKPGCEEERDPREERPQNDDPVSGFLEGADSRDAKT